MRCACAKKCAESKRTLHFVHLSYKTMKRLCWVQPHWQTKRLIFGPPDASRPLGQGLSGNLWCFSFMSLKQATGSLATFFDKRCSMFQFCSEINKKLLQKRSLLSKNHKLPPTKAEWFQLVPLPPVQTPGCFQLTFCVFTFVCFKFCNVAAKM